MQVRGASVEEYFQGVHERLTADGCEVGWEQVGPLQALVGRRRDFVAAAMSRIHLVTAVARFGAVTAVDVDRFTRDVSSHAKQTTGALRGAQSGIGAFAVLVGDSVDPGAISEAVRKPRMEFAVRSQPTVIDLSTGQLHTFTGTMIWGFALNGHLRRKLALYV